MRPLPGMKGRGSDLIGPPALDPDLLAHENSSGLGDVLLQRWSASAVDTLYLGWPGREDKPNATAWACLCCGPDYCGGTSANLMPGTQLNTCPKGSEFRVFSGESNSIRTCDVHPV
jgi:hypothetical protein